jgi:thiosulfate/3-mercaptopyruvate sulfurtransferase
LILLLLKIQERRLRMSSDKVFVGADDVAALGEAVMIDAHYSLMEPSTFGKRKYAEAHIPGAVFADCEENLCVPTKDRDPTKGRHPLPPANDFIRWCLANGIDGSKPVVVYDGEGGPMCAARAWWMLTSLGATAYILNGGLPAWIAAGKPTTTDVPTTVPAAAWTKGNEWTLVETDPHAIREVALTKRHLIVDARPEPRYGSTVRVGVPMDPAPGHIENAISLPAMSFVADRFLKDSKERLVEAFGAVDVQKDVIFSCGSGVTACMTLAATQHFGLGRGRLYSGSWSEYGVLFNYEIVKAIVDKEGVHMNMVKVDMQAKPLSEAPDTGVYVDDVKVADWRATEGPLRKVFDNIRCGEEAHALFAGGKTQRVRVDAV